MLLTKYMFEFYSYYYNYYYSILIIISQNLLFHPVQTNMLEKDTSRCLGGD